MALDGPALEALEAVRLQRGIRYPREVIALLLGEERARLQNGVTAHAERPELSTLNAGSWCARSLAACRTPAALISTR